jgi:hypothetical protein
MPILPMPRYVGRPRRTVPLLCLEMPPSESLARGKRRAKAVEIDVRLPKGTAVWAAFGVTTGVGGRGTIFTRFELDPTVRGAL